MRSLRIVTTAAVTALASSITPCLAEPWPQRTVRLIVPVGPGAAPDIVARLFAERLAERWRQPVIVENRPGADGVIGVAAFVNARDDHALLFAFSGPITALPLLREKARYDPDRDLVPIVSAADSFVSVATSTSAKSDSLAELVARARAQPRKLNYNASAGALPFLFAGFLNAAKLEMLLVPYRELGLAVNDLAEGRLQVMLTSMAALRGPAQAGKVRYLAVTNKTRASIAPDIPTVTEAGYSDLTYEGLFGFFGSRDISVERRDRIAGDVREIATGPAIVNRLATIGLVTRVSGPAQFSTALAEERARMARIATQIESKPER